MKTQLIITEKPSVAEKIAQALKETKIEKHKEGKVAYYILTRNNIKISIVCAVGHLYTVTEKDKKGWKYPTFNTEWKASYEVNKDSAYIKPYLTIIKKLCKDSEEIIIATDWDIEGEVIGERILKFICKKSEAKRMNYSTTTKEDLLSSYEHLAKTYDKKLAEAGITRHELDFIFGINLSRALTLSIKHALNRFKILSSGRVQGPALKILYNRELEIENFKPVPFFEIYLNSETKKKEIIKAQHEKGKIEDKKEAEKIYKKIKDEKNATIKNIEKRQYKQLPPFPFDLTTLQTEAYSVLKITPKKTLEIAQNLYTNSYISYPRTSSQKLPESIGYKKILKKLETKFKEECTFLLSKENLKPREGDKTDPAHPSCYPTGEIPKKLSPQEAKLYELIVRRFFSVFGEQALRETQTLTIDVKKENFVAKGTVTLKPGWHDLYKPFLKIKEETLPIVILNDSLHIKKINLEKKETQPPARYNEASIIKELEAKSLGTKSTRSTIIDNLFQRNYTEGRPIKVTELGKKTINTLLKYCPEILDEKLTRDFEEDMEAIQQKEKKGSEVIEAAEKFLTISLKKFKTHEKEIGKELGEANIETQQKQSKIGPCPICKKGELTIKRGKFGLFIACTEYPKCNATFKIPQGKILSNEKSCEQCNYPTIKLIKARRAPQILCINPDCPTKKINEKEILSEKRKCPNCGTELIIRKSAYGAFLACPNYPKCKHIEAIKQNKDYQKK
ncbi:MAG TPA: DNA topoisomerase I [Candidatus Nanoarchaeia archaeon]|nr:DNA topoisomerase I [Candidatus Nanoarchaeia archaeon]